MTDITNECLAWGRDQLQALAVGGASTATLVKRRPWSTVWKLDTQAGLFYLKEAAPGFDIEAPLLRALCQWRPQSIVELVAVNDARGWVITRDAGPMLHDVMFDAPATGRAHLRSILLAYAALQVDSLRPDAQPLALMLEHRNPRTMPDALAAIIDDEKLLLAGGATTETLALRSVWLRTADRLCRELTDLNLPLALEHGDLHTSNIMISTAGAPRIADWGDACWAIPLHGLVMCLDDVIGRGKIASEDPWLSALTDAYVAIWRQHGFAADFHRAVPLARALAPVTGVLQWSRGINHMPPEGRATMAAQIVKHLRRLG